MPLLLAGGVRCAVEVSDEAEDFEGVLELVVLPEFDEAVGDGADSLLPVLRELAVPSELLELVVLPLLAELEGVALSVESAAALFFFLLFLVGVVPAVSPAEASDVSAVVDLDLLFLGEVVDASGAAVVLSAVPDSAALAFFFLLFLVDAVSPVV